MWVEFYGESDKVITVDDDDTIDDVDDNITWWITMSTDECWWWQWRSGLGWTLMNPHADRWDVEDDYILLFYFIKKYYDNE